MNIYEIDKAILDCVDEETGEILDFDRLEELQMAKDEKIENIAMWIKNLNAQAAGIKAEETALAERRRVKENRANRLKEYLNYILNGQKFETARVNLSFRNSTAVEISDKDMLLDWLERNSKENCIKYLTPEISKTEVGKLLKAGEEVPGAALVTKTNVQVR